MTIKRINKKKAPGLDILPVEVIKEVDIANKPLFMRLLNLCIKAGYFPKSKREKLVLFYKEVKAIKDPSRCRRICLLDSWGYWISYRSRDSSTIYTGIKRRRTINMSSPLVVQQQTLLRRW